MGVRRDPNRSNRWFYEFQFNKQVFTGYPKDANGHYVRKRAEAEAAEADAKKRAKAAAGMARSGLKPGSYLLAQAIDRHTGNLLDASASHLKSLARIGSEMLLFFGPMRAVIDIATADVDDYRKFLVDQNRRVWLGGPRRIVPADYANPALWKEIDRKRSASEVNHCLDLLRSAFKAAHTVRDPLTGHSSLPFPPDVKAVHDPDRDPTPMPDEEFYARLKGAPLWVQHVALLERFFGLRKTEALIVGPQHLDHDNRCLRLKAHENKSGKDKSMYGGRPGWIFARWLERRARRLGPQPGGCDRLALWPGHAWFKAHRRGEKVPDDAWRPIKTIRRAWTDTIARAGIKNPHRQHDVRAAYITDAARLGSTTITKGLARHASFATSEKYIKLVDTELADAADRAAELARDRNARRRGGEPLQARSKLRVVR